MGAGRVQPYCTNQSVGVGGALTISMSNYAEKIHNELGQAFSVVDESALQRASSLLAEHHADALTYLNDRSVMQSELRVLSETMRQFMAFAERRFDQIDKRFDQVDKRIDQVEKRIDQVEKRIDQVEKRIDQVEKRIDQVEKRIDQVDKRIDQVHKRIDQVEKRIDQVDKRIDHVEQRFETRFDAIDRRFARLHTLMMSGFSILAILMSLFKFIQ